MQKKRKHETRINVNKNTQTIIMKQYLNLTRSWECEAINIRFQDYAADCLCCHIKREAKQTKEPVKIHSVVCESASFLKRIIVVRKSPL